MSRQKSLSYLGALWAALCVELVTFSMVTPQIKAQTLVSVTFPKTQRVGAPSRTGGGGVRSGTPVACVRGNVPLTVIAPANNLGTTVSANPNVFLYVPPTQAKSAEFVVVDEQDNEVYQTTMVLRGASGVMKLSLPSTVSLKTNKNYRWQFALLCDPANPQQDVWVEGWLQRTQLTSQQKSQLAATKDPLQQAQVYADAKIWQESLTILAQLRQNRPNDSRVTEAWQEFLNSVGLQAIATAPVVECCTTSSRPR